MLLWDQKICHSLGQSRLFLHLGAFVHLHTWGKFPDFSIKLRPYPYDSYTKFCLRRGNALSSENNYLGTLNCCDNLQPPTNLTWSIQKRRVYPSINPEYSTKGSLRILIVVVLFSVIRILEFQHWIIELGLQDYLCIAVLLCYLISERSCKKFMIIFSDWCPYCRFQFLFGLWSICRL